MDLWTVLSHRLKASPVIYCTKRFAGSTAFYSIKKCRGTLSRIRDSQNWLSCSQAQISSARENVSENVRHRETDASSSSRLDSRNLSGWLLWDVSNTLTAVAPKAREKNITCFPSAKPDIQRIRISVGYSLPSASCNDKMPKISSSLIEF